MRANKWLDLAAGRIRFGSDRRAVREELFDHIESQREAITARHPELTAEEAEERAVAAMGDPEPLARELERLHKPWLGYLWRLSQVLVVLALAAAMCVGIWQLVREEGARGPGPYLQALAAWDAEDYLPTGKVRLAQSLAAPQKGKVSVGGYTISSPGAALITVMPQNIRFPSITGAYPCRILYVELDIGCGLRGEAMDLIYAVSYISDSSGKVYDMRGEGSGRWTYVTPRAWGELAPLGQKALLAVWDVPEWTEWVDVTFGWGENAGTMRIELSEVAA